MHHLSLDQLLVHTITILEQLFMSATLRDFSFLDHYDLIRISDGAKSVCNHNDGLVARLDKSVQSSLNLVLAFRVKS